MEDDHLTEEGGYSSRLFDIERTITAPANRADRSNLVY